MMIMRLPSTLTETAPVMAVLMVRNEAGRVGRALRSVRAVADSWLVMDTGSTDGTLVEVERATEGWPGALVQRPWQDFGASRTELIKIAQASMPEGWLLTIDADHILEGADDLRLNLTTATADAVLLPFAGTPMVWTTRLIRAELPWSYVGTTREYLDCAEPYTVMKVDRPRIRDLADGSSRSEKWDRDIALLSEQLRANPDDARAWFYLGESYRGKGQPQSAMLAYTNCAVKTKAPEEKYLALVLSAEMLIELGQSQDGLARLLLANRERPARREALLMACQLLNKLGRHAEVIKLLRAGVAATMPTNDTSGLLPEAYGPAMSCELEAARSGQRRGSAKRR